MALFKKQDKKNEKEEKDLQTGKNAGKVSLDDDLLGAVSGGVDLGGNRGYDGGPGIVYGTSKF